MRATTAADNRTQVVAVEMYPETLALLKEQDLTGMLKAWQNDADEAGRVEELQNMLSSQLQARLTLAIQEFWPMGQGVNLQKFVGEIIEFWLSSELENHRNSL